MTTEPTFAITLADLKALADAMCAVDGPDIGFDRDRRALVHAGHGAIIRTLGPQVELVYGIDDGSEAAEAKAAA